MTISSFKAHALRKIAQVADRREALVITRRGRPIVQVVPWTSTKKNKAVPGQLRHLLMREDDIVTPASKTEDWEACR